MAAFPPTPRAKTVVAPQSYDYITSDTGAGSKARLEVAEQLITHLARAKPLVLFPQGFDKDHIYYPCRKGDISLGQNLADYLKAQPGMDVAEIIHEPRSWTTRWDIIATYDMVAKQGYDIAHIHFVSDKCHIWRVKIVWWLTHPKDWTASFHFTDQFQMTPFERFVREPIACVVYAIKLLSWRIFHGRHVPSHS
ncbi:MAG: hypothetical protein V4526_00385 [Patescibacteria group bacterium]